MNIKKYILLFTITLLNYSCNTSNEQKNDLEKANLKGSVKSTTENTYQAIEKFGEVVKGEKITNDVLNPENNISIYNKHGNLIENNLGGFIPTKYEYNKKNQLILQNEYTSNTKLKYTYDKNNLLVEMNNYYKDTLVQKQKNKYDSKGNVIECNSYDYSGKLSFKIKNKFEGRKIVERKQFNNDGSLSETNKYKYDNNGNIIEDITMDSNNRVTNKYNYVFDKNNNLIEWRVFINNDIRNESNTYKFKYLKFDSNKNWTEQIEFENDMPIKIKERTIEYY